MILTCSTILLLAVFTEPRPVKFVRTDQLSSGNYNPYWTRRSGTGTFYNDFLPSHEETRNFASESDIWHRAVRQNRRKKQIPQREDHSSKNYLTNGYPQVHHGLQEKKNKTQTTSTTESNIISLLPRRSVDLTNTKTDHKNTAQNKISLLGSDGTNIDDINFVMDFYKTLSASPKDKAAFEKELSAMSEDFNAKQEIASIENKIKDEQTKLMKQEESENKNKPIASNKKSEEDFSEEFFSKRTPKVHNIESMDTITSIVGAILKYKLKRFFFWADLFKKGWPIGLNN